MSPLKSFHVNYSTVAPLNFPSHDFLQELPLADNTDGIYLFMRCIDMLVLPLFYLPCYLLQEDFTSWYGKLNGDTVGPSNFFLMLRRPEYDSTASVS